MRWNTPKDGDIKIKRKFALFPIEINNEVRWLEFVNIQYMYREKVYIQYKNDIKGYIYTGWTLEAFVD